MTAAAMRFFLRVGVALLVAAACPNGWARAAPALSPVKSGIRIGGVEYVDAANFGARFGLKAQANAPRGELVLKGKDVTVTLEIDSRECAIGAQRVFLGEPVRRYRGRVCFSRVDAERLFTPILRPGFAQRGAPRVRVIALDPGHGGKDPGKSNARLKISEKALALDTAQRLATLLKARGFKVVMTRAGDKFIELEDRPAMARRLGADLFISLHYNAAAAPGARGVEVFTLTPRYQYSTSDTERDDAAAVKEWNPGNAHDHWSTLLGFSLHREMVQGLKVTDRGLRRARWAVLRPASCPAVLVESGYLTNDTEARQIATPAYRQRIAAAIAKGVQSYAATVDQLAARAAN